MKTILLSFSYEWYSYLRTGEKIYEHRKRFCKDPVLAYLYIGVPLRQIVAIVELGSPILIEKWLDEYKNDSAALERIEDCLTRNKVAMPILRFQEITPIDIREIETNNNGFRVPISYMYLDDKPQLFEDISSRVELIGKEIKHQFNSVTSDKICRC